MYTFVQRTGTLVPGGKGDWSSAVLGRFVQQWFYWVMAPVERAALSAGLGPLFFNLLGVGFGMAAAALLATHRISAAGWAILLGGVCDILDGQIARARGVAGPRGAFLDSMLDRFAELAVFMGLSLLFVQNGPVGLLVTTALGGSLLVSYARARGEAVGVSCTTGLMQRAERLLMLGFGAVVDPAVSSWWSMREGSLLTVVLALIAVGTIGTAVYRTIWIVRRVGHGDGR
jgi:CDP-diacylglycerol--glycerol-3-phosphate 3-phosphatidyltransferase